MLKSWDGKVWGGRAGLDSRDPLGSAAHSVLGEGRGRGRPTELVWLPSGNQCGGVGLEPHCPEPGQNLQRQKRWPCCPDAKTSGNMGSEVASASLLGLRNLSCSHGSECFLLPRPVIPEIALKVNRCKCARSCHLAPHGWRAVHAAVQRSLKGWMA